MKCRNSNCNNEVGNGPGTQHMDTEFCSQACYSSAFLPREDPTFKGTVTQGNRYNEGKARLDLIPPDVLIRLGEHYTYGANKYAPNNWMKGFPYSETYASLTRHLFAWWNGESRDPESGNHHLVAVIWNAVTLFYFELHRGQYSKFDDRPWCTDFEGRDGMDREDERPYRSTSIKIPATEIRK